MENFKEIVEKCAAGELYGTIILNNGREFYSKYLSQYIFNGQIVEDFYTIGLAKYLFHVEQIINFIPNNMQEQIKIDIPEGKVPVTEQTETGVVITWKDKELTYKDIENKIILKNTRDCIIGYTPVIEDIKTLNCPHSDFYKKVEVLRKLTNIRNYFGKPSKKNSASGWVICINGTVYRAIVEQNSHVPVFVEKEHAEQAIKMLGDELKYLFKPW